MLVHRSENSMMITITCGLGRRGRGRLRDNVKLEVDDRPNLAKVNGNPMNKIGSL